MLQHPLVLAMTAHAERVSVLALLGLLVVVGWCSVALGMASGSDESGGHLGSVVTKRDGTTTIVVGGPYAASAIVVEHPREAVTPEPATEDPVGLDDPAAAVVAEATAVLADAATVESLWALPAATDDERRPARLQA